MGADQLFLFADLLSFLVVTRRQHQVRLRVGAMHLPEPRKLSCRVLGQVQGNEPPEQPIVAVTARTVGKRQRQLAAREAFEAVV